MNSYRIRQVDKDAQVVSEQPIQATSADVALRHLNQVNQGTRRINVYNEDDQQVCQVDVDYWRQKYRRAR